MNPQRSILASVLAAFAVAESIQAESDSDRFAMEEVVVTAQKRAENSQDISVVVDAFGSEALKNMGIKNAADISNVSPGVVISNMTGDSTPTISIRGIGVGGASYFANQPNSASVNVDGVYLPSAIMSNFQIFDVQQVEVLKGPQGTLYGRNSTAGAVNFYTNKPGDEQEGYASISYSRFDTARLEAAVGGPLNERFNYRIATVYDHSDGNVTNNFDGKDVNGTDRFAARLQLQYTPSDDTEILFSLNGGRDQSGIFHYQTQPAEAPGNGLDRFAYEEPCISLYNPIDAGCLSSSQSLQQSASAYDGDNFKVNDNLDDETDIKALGGSMTIERDLDGMSLTSITAFNSFSRYYAEDADGGPTTELHIYFDEDFDSFSQEIRLTSTTDSPLQWIAGMYYSTLDAEMHRVADFTDLGNAAYGPGGAYGIVYANKIDETAWALFTHSTYELSEQLTLVMGLRYSYEDKEIDIVSDGFGADARLMSFDAISASSTDCADFRTPPAQCNGTPFGPQSDSWSNLSGKLGIEWRLSEDVLAFAHYSRGFKSGGFPGSIGVKPARIVSYEPENVDAYETGAKTNFAEGAGLFNLSFFYIDYQDKQEYANFPSDPTLFDFINAGESTVKGLELQLGYSFAFDARVDFGMAYINAEYDRFHYAPDDDRSGHQMAYAPELTGNIQYTQRFDLNSDTQLEVATNLSYTGEQYFDSGEREAFSAEGYFLWNARANLSFDGYGVEASLFVNNLADEEYRAGGVDQATGQYGLTYGRQRTIGLELRKVW
jgi:iron complex outermembrane receptor protein